MQRKLILISACLLLASCSFRDFHFRLPGVYRIDIPQGNIVTQEMIDKLQPGMTKRQVRYVMGTPLLIDTFEQERWDYLHSLETRHTERQQERVSLYFDKDLLVRIEGDLAPSGANVSQSANAGAEQPSAAAAIQPEEQQQTQQD